MSSKLPEGMIENEIKVNHGEISLRMVKIQFGGFIFEEFSIVTSLCVLCYLEEVCRASPHSARLQGVTRPQARSAAFAVSARDRHYSGGPHTVRALVQKPLSSAVPDLAPRPYANQGF